MKPRWLQRFLVVSSAAATLGGAVTNVTLKSGTNELKGTA